MSNRDVCPLCGCEDSWRHALLSCTTSQCVWALLDDEIVAQMAEIMEPNARIWLFELNEKLDQANFTKMVVTPWSVWYVRRKAIYESIFQSPQHTVSFVTNFIAELGQLQPSGTSQETSSAPRPQVRRWLPPPGGFVKVNVDGVVARSYHGGAVAAVCRDQTGLFLGSSAVVYRGINDPLILETYACEKPWH